MQKITNDETRAEKKSRYNKAYDKANVRYFSLKLNKKTDADLIEILDKCDNVQAYIKEVLKIHNKL